MCAASGARRVVAITGSAGKTTTKEAMAAALGAKFNVLKSPGQSEQRFGLPLQLLRLEPEHEIAVVEMGMNHAGEIAALARIAAPDWGVVTNVGTAHIENFADGQAGIARAKFELVAALPATGVAFLNCDDPYVSQFGRDFSRARGLLWRRPLRRSAILERPKIWPGCTCVSRRRARGRADAASAGRAQRIERAGRTGRRAGSRRRSGCGRRRARVAHRRRQARPGDRDQTARPF
jgi:UDP-N-acetylmuramoylalanine-D-glutamate ligase